MNDISPSFINISRKESIGINIYYIDHFYLDDDDDIELKSFYFAINDVYGYFEENIGKKYFNIANTHNNKKILQKYMLLWDDIKDIIENKGGKPFSKFVKDNMTFKTDTDDDILLNKDLDEGIDVNKTSNSRECWLCHFWYFLDKNLNYQKYYCDGCHDMLMKTVSIKNLAIVYSKGNAYRIHFWNMSKKDAISIIYNSNLIDKKDVL